MIRHGVFEIREHTHPGPRRERVTAVQQVIDALEDCTFPWWLALDGLERRRTVGINVPFPIEWEENARDGARGYVSRRRMWLALHAPPETVSHELCHVADLACLPDHSWSAGQVSDLRQQLLDLATHHDDDRPHPHTWQPRAAPWSQHPIEAITVPWTRAFFTDPRFYYPEHRFVPQMRPSVHGHTWDNPDKVKDLFLQGGSMPFNDVDPNSTHADGIHWAAEHGLIDGYEDGTYGPHDPVTRGQLATILHRYHRSTHA